MCKYCETNTWDNLSLFWMGESICDTKYESCKIVRKNDEDSMKQTVRNYPNYKRDEDAEIESYEQIDLTDETNRVL